MKKICVVVAGLLILGLAGVAGATSSHCGSYCGENQFDFYDTKTVSDTGAPGYGHWFSTLNQSFTWNFNLDTDALTPLGRDINPLDTINKAELNITFADDERDTHSGSTFHQEEFAKLILDGSAVEVDDHYYFEVDNGTESFGVRTYLTSDHQLSVEIKNVQHGGVLGDFGVTRLEIHGCYTDNTPSQVPEPASMLLLGFGLLGVAGIKRFKK